MGDIAQLWFQGYTELFFLDEATALAAGHRPCGECRRADVKRFRACDPTAELDLIDKSLRSGIKPTLLTHSDLERLPDDIILGHHETNTFWLLHQRQLLQWTFHGYRQEQPPQQDFVIQTPELIVEALLNGYDVSLHESASIG